MSHDATAIAPLSFFPALRRRDSMLQCYRFFCCGKRIRHSERIRSWSFSRPNFIVVFTSSGEQSNRFLCESKQGILNAMPNRIKADFLRSKPECAIHQIGGSISLTPTLNGRKWEPRGNANSLCKFESGHCAKISSLSSLNDAYLFLLAEQKT